MKITVLSGEDHVKARERFVQIITAIKARGWEIVSVNPSLKLSDQLRRDSLFGNTILFTLEDMSKLQANDFKWLNDNFEKLEGNLLVLHKGELGKLIQRKLPGNTKFENFDLPKELFKFLDLVYPQNYKQVLTTLNRVTQVEPVELVFSLLCRHVRDLYWVSLDVKSTGFPSWKVSKLNMQAKKFKIENLKNLINKLAEIDIQVKTSQANLKESLDLLLFASLQ